ncbi:transcription-repair coupling factor [bacterium SCSIO 12643]|nr:transcription-repair coupling factor [bacterium SCSIO 12643]
MTKESIKEAFADHPIAMELMMYLRDADSGQFKINGLVGSGASLLINGVISHLRGSHLIVANDREEAAYLHNDFLALLPENKLHFLPASSRTPYREDKVNDVDVLQRTETLDAVSHRKEVVVITYPEALSERVVTRKELKSKTLDIQIGDEISLDFINELLDEYRFEREDFVSKPGEYAIRGGIVDIFSYNHDLPYRVEFFGDEVDSIRTFDPATQLSDHNYQKISIVPDVRDQMLVENRINVLEFFTPSTTIWFKDVQFAIDKVEKEFNLAVELYPKTENKETVMLPPEELYIWGKKVAEICAQKKVVEYGLNNFYTQATAVQVKQAPQPVFNKNFELLSEQFEENTKAGIQNVIASSSAKQIDRLHNIFEDLERQHTFSPILLDLHQGFVDQSLKIACYTDHQIFERFHRFHLKEGFKKSQQDITLQDLAKLETGDYVTHVDHGIGKFAGLVKVDNNGKKQEAIKLIYRDNDVLYVSIHSLHRIARYTGKDGTEPKVHKIGSPAWKNTKSKTKSRIKKIAYDLIKLYAQRKSVKGFQYAPDSYLQHELEASFIYEDTPDQEKSTLDVKTDMESETPMDRLVCGDVGFGKTEVAIRAAFKAAVNGKQVAVLVPTTILAMQHHKSFSNRLKDFPVTVEYVNRFRTAGQTKEVLRKLKDGKVDILIGTHRIVGKDVEFKDLGLLIIDEEQKFGVAVKDKLKTLKANVDTLTLTATPIPRTLQFSMMGARDLSVISTPPPNRQPVETEVHTFNEQIFKDAISYEIARDGQVFIVNNRVANLEEIANLVRRVVPGTRVVTGHGQLDGKELEKRMMAFVNGEYDVLVATTIIESGLDIPNANTILINNAHHFGLSDLHQMRGRVGRSNRKAFCYLIAPPMSALTTEGRKRLEAISQFSDLGSGINIAMRDLDIRGAGDLLGGEQTGFISEIGFEMYQKILDEAIEELKENEFKEMYASEEKEYVRDTALESDLEILIPDRYVQNVAERLKLYKVLADSKTEQDLEVFAKQLIDRFGPLPDETRLLIESVKLKWKAKDIGFEKLVLKSNKLIGYFVSNQQSSYYESPYFHRVLDFVQRYPQKAQLKEKSGKLSLVFEQVTELHFANDLLQGILDFNSGK